ncbi:cilia- and flagella-associated protein 100 [Diretmus argenteus]
MRSGTLVVSETGSVAESSKPDVKTRRTRLSPFKVPDDNSVLLLRSHETEKRKEEMREYLSLPVHEKITYGGRMKAKQRQLRKELVEEEEETLQMTERRVGPLQGRPTLRAAMIKGENIEKESTVDFITKKREMFLLEYSLMVKRSEIKKLEDATAEEERRLRRAQQILEEDSLLFEEFLRENDKNSVEAIKIAEQETKSKLDRMAEIKRLSSDMVTIKSEISKNEEILEEFKMYESFLFKLSPPEWQRARNKAPEAPEAHVLTEREEEREKETGRKKSGEEPELYFSDPQQLMDLLTELEEQNLSLIQNSRDTEEALEELRQATEANRKKMEQDEEELTLQISIMTASVAAEKQKAADLELKSRLFNFGKFRTGEQDVMLDSLGGKVEEVYRSCVEDAVANLSTLQMLASIERHLSTLLENLESIPAETLEKVEKIKDRERRVRQREEKLSQQKLHQEERMKKALERSQADVKKTMVKKPTPRSKPFTRKMKSDNVNNTSDDDEIHNYLFT